MDAVRNAVAKAHDAGIDFCANFMFGLPGDDYDSMQDTLDLALELMPAFPSFFCAMAIPGSDLYEEALKKGLPLPGDVARICLAGIRFSAPSDGTPLRGPGARIQGLCLRHLLQESEISRMIGTRFGAPGAGPHKGNDRR